MTKVVLSSLAALVLASGCVVSAVEEGGLAPPTPGPPTATATEIGSSPRSASEPTAQGASIVRDDLQGLFILDTAAPLPCDRSGSSTPSVLRILGGSDDVGRGSVLPDSDHVSTHASAGTVLAEGGRLELDRTELDSNVATVPVTVALWFEPGPFGGPLLRLGGDWGKGGAPLIEVSMSNARPERDKLACTQSITLAVAGRASQTSCLPPGPLRLAALSIGDGRIELTLDGQSVASASTNSSISADAITVGGNGWSGLIVEVALFDRSLNGVDLATLAKAGPGAVIGPGPTIEADSTVRRRRRSRGGRPDHRRRTEARRRWTGWDPAASASMST